MKVEQKEKTVADYRHDIQLLKHKLAKLQEHHDEMKQRKWLNESTETLYTKPITLSKKNKTIQYYFDELYKVTRYRGFTLESLFRSVDIDSKDFIEVSAFHKFLSSYLQPFEIEDPDKEEAMAQEVQKMVSYLCSAFDHNLTGYLNRQDYSALLQIYRVESEPFTFVSQRFGAPQQSFQNIYEQAIDTINRAIKEQSLDIQSIITQLQSQYPNAKVYTREQFTSFCHKFYNLSLIHTGALFNLADRYLKLEITSKQLSQVLTSLTSPAFDPKEATQFLNLNINCDYSKEMQEFRALLTTLKQSPADIFQKCDVNASGKVPLGDLVQTIEQSIAFKYNSNRVIKWLRLIDQQLTYVIDNFSFVYALISADDIAVFSSDEKQRAKLHRCSPMKNDLEILSLLAFRLKSFNMRPMNWFQMIQKSVNQQSVSVQEVRESLYKIGLDASQAVQILKLLDTNSNLYVEYTEIAALFGKSFRLKETEDIQVTVRRFVDFLMQRYGTVNDGVEKVFAKYDTNKRGMLSREEFLYALDSIDDQAQLTEDQKSTIMDKADKNRDNQITLKEFKDFLMQSVDFGLPQKKVTQSRDQPLTPTPPPQKIPIPAIKQTAKRQSYDHQAEIVHYLRFSAKEQSAFDFYRLMDTLESSHSEYEDPEFVAESQSISARPRKYDKSQDLWWVRPEFFLDKSEPIQLFRGKIEPNDIKQGLLGDCYLLSSLSVMSERPILVKRIIENNDVNDAGLYGVWMCLNGKWKCVYLDDRIPCQRYGESYQTSFSRANGPELWVLLLEKAYAKAYGSYEKIEGGLTGQALRDLTGSPYYFFKVQDSREVWEFLKKNEMFLLTAGSQVENHEKQTGIVSSHAYAILDLQTVNVKGNPVNLIKMRNPWGKGEWTGRWSDGSSEWTEELKVALKYEKGDDGVFWMQIEDFVKSFDEVCCNKLYEDYIYTSIQIKCTPSNSNIYRGYIKIQSSSTNCHAFFTFSQIDKRTYLGQQYEYSVVRCMLWKGKKEQRVQILADAMGCERDLVFETTLKDKDEYGLYFEIDWSANNNVPDFPQQIVISSYSNYENTFYDQTEVANPTEQENLIIQLLQGVNTSQLQLNRYIENALIVRAQGQAAGYLYFRYTNNSETSTLYENLALKNARNLTLINLSKLTVENKIEVKPKGQYSLYFRVSAGEQGAFSFQVNTSYKVINAYTDEQLIDMAESKPNRVKQREGPLGKLDVFVYDYMYDDGLAILYRNKSLQVYSEKLTLELTNLTTPQNEYLIILKPMQTFLIKAKIVKADRPISYSQSYMILPQK